MDGKFKEYGQIVLMVMMLMPLIDLKIVNVWFLVMILANLNYLNILVLKKKVDVSNIQDIPHMSVESNLQIVVNTLSQLEVMNYQYFNGDISFLHPN